jgi:tetratricopeptide (TPR) repeat protein
MAMKDHEGGRGSIVSEHRVLLWAPEPEGPGLRVVGADEDRILRFDPASWRTAPPRLEGDAAAAYRTLAGQGEFGRWWLGACGGDLPGVRRFFLRLPAEHWERPWEALVGGLDAKWWNDVSLIRQTSTDSGTPHPQELDGPLRMLVIQGAASGAGLTSIDLAAEMALIEAAYDSMDLGARQAVARPVPLRSRRSDLVSALVEHRPAVLWLSGHGRGDPPGFLLDDGSWLDPPALAEVVRAAAAQGGRTPLYVVLWACETGSLPPFSAPEAAPRFVAALSAEGVLAVLATQARLGDAAARALAGRVFEGLARGRPLDHAVAHSRGHLMRRAAEGLDEHADWVAPVVWCAGTPPARLAWRDHREILPQRQVLARKLLPANLADRLAVVENPQASSGTWADVKRLWVGSPVPGSVDIRTSWVASVLAIQLTAERAALWFDFSTGPAHRSLTDWAQMVARRVEHDDDHDRLVRTAADEVRTDFEAGWRKLCHNPMLALALIEPPENDADWLWEGLRTQPGAQAIVLAGDFPESRAQEGWKFERLGGAQTVNASWKTSDRSLMAAFAVLRSPAARADVEAVIGRKLDECLRQGLLVETSAGCVMPLSVAEAVAGSLSPQERQQGNRVAYDLLDGPVAHRKLTERNREDILQARFSHAQECAWEEAIATEAQNLLALYWRQQRPAALLSVFERTKSFRRSLPAETTVQAGWAYLAQGDPDVARAWLDLVEPDELDRPADQVMRLMLLAEVEKSSGDMGSKERARQLLERALLIAPSDSTDTATRHQRLRCLHDIARLVHFFDGRPDAAAERYREVEEGWQREPHSELERAIALRNLAEAVMDAATGRGDLEKADGYVAQARRLVPKWTQHAVVSEIEYFAGRLALRLERPKEDVVRSFEQCRQLALWTNHLMMAAIAEARLFWYSDQGVEFAGLFNEAEWHARAETLLLFDRHAWAARVLIDGRLRAARRLAIRGERNAARRQLADAWRLIGANPAFDAGSDRERVVRLHAGLALFDPAEMEWWQRLTERYTWASAWLKARAVLEPTAAWDLIR